MEIRDNEKFCIFAPLGGKLNLRESERLLNEISKETRQIGIDLKYVYDCTIEFIEAIKVASNKKPIAIFNIPSDIFVLFNIMKLDKVANLYVSESDFEEKSRRLINRQFELVKNY